MEQAPHQAPQLLNQLLTAVRAGPHSLVLSLYNAAKERNEEGQLTADDANLCLFLAAQNGRATTVEWLIRELGASVNHNTHGRSPIYIAAKFNHVEVVRLLLEKGAHINQGKRTGASALCVAAKSGNVEVVRFLAQAGAKTNLADERGWTPVRAACVG